MKKKCSKKIQILAMLMAFVLAVPVFAPALTVKAEEDIEPYFWEDYTERYEPKSRTSNEHLVEIYDFPKNGKIKKIKSSNSKVVKASWSPKKPNYIQLKLKKKGKATISFNIVYKGKTKKFKCKVNVTNYQNPCKTFKINGKNYTSQFKKRSENVITYKKNKKYKFNYKASKGWELERIDLVNTKTDEATTVKNNKAIKIPNGKGSYSVEAWFRNKKSSQMQCIRMILKKK